MSECQFFGFYLFFLVFRPLRTIVILSVCDSNSQRSERENINEIIHHSNAIIIVFAPIFQYVRLRYVKWMEKSKKGQNVINYSFDCSALLIHLRTSIEI